MRYRYQEAATEKTVSTLWHEELASFPSRTPKGAGGDGVISLDIERIDSVIARISKQNPALGSTLSQYAERYAFSSILQALGSRETIRS